MSARTNSLCLLLLLAAPVVVRAAPDTQTPPQRRIPGRPERQQQPPARQPDPNGRTGLQRVSPPPPDARYPIVPTPERRRLPQQAGLVTAHWYDPYHQNRYKGDLPLYGDHYLSLSFTSDSLAEARRLPTPVGPQATNGPARLDVLGQGRQTLFDQRVSAGAVFYAGDTVFMPPHYALRFKAVADYNVTRAREARVVDINPQEGTFRRDEHLGVQELSFEKHLRDVSPRYDFDAMTVGIQPVTADFRGFLFLDEPFGVRFFGTRNNNVYQYSAGWFRRLEKDTNSGLNDLSRRPREEDILLANLFWQDMPVRGFTTEFVLAHDRNRESGRDHYNDNGFLVRPAPLGLDNSRDYQVTYLGLGGDGHFGRYNLTAMAYGAWGRQTHGVFVDGSTDIRAAFVAAEASMDFDWTRWRLSAAYASGDRNPWDRRETGFDAINENPLFAGSATSFWIRQAVPLIGGGAVELSGRNGMLNSLRSSKEEGQANFTNPGLRLVGLGNDTDLTPQWRVSTNLNHLWFDETSVLEAARNQGSIHRDIGWDLSVSAIWRPFFTQNVIVRGSVAGLQPGQGYRDLFGGERGYSALLQLTLTY
ncbi:MAG: hypothetical protein PVI56_08200 [Gammaproteobacteria bacterium]|jgi:hypothetical protein